MRSTCNNCKALNVTACRLGFKTKAMLSATIKDKLENVRPVELCPKPTTNRDYIYYANKALDFININNLVEILVDIYDTKTRYGII